MAIRLTTHVLDLTSGSPAQGVRVDCYHGESLLRTTWTNADGRVDRPLAEGETLNAGRYRIDFHVGEYFEARKHPDARRFLDVVPIVFVVSDASRSYHVPLLVTPWGYSTYRGS